MQILGLFRRAHQTRELALITQERRTAPASLFQEELLVEVFDRYSHRNTFPDTACEPLFSTTFTLPLSINTTPSLCFDRFGNSSGSCDKQGGDCSKLEQGVRHKDLAI